MKDNDRIKVNYPHVVHDTIEGETILVNLKNGHYYSFDKSGVVIWEVITQNQTLNELSRIVTNIFKGQKEKVENVITVFVEKLIAENLVIIDNDEIVESSNLDVEEIKLKYKDIISNFEDPVLHVYADMQDVLLLDPIHDTDEKGWPSGKDEFQ